MVVTERDALRAKLKKSDEEMDKIKAENSQFREERDRLRKRVKLFVWFVFFILGLNKQNVCCFFG